MDYLRRGNKELIKDINRALVINRIRSGDPISRTEIARDFFDEYVAARASSAEAG